MSFGGVILVFRGSSFPDLMPTCWTVSEFPLHQADDDKGDDFMAIPFSQQRPRGGER
jgi:hypothetical protein